MPRQRVQPQERTFVTLMNTATEQVAQHFETESDRDAAYEGATIPTTTITHIAEPSSEELRWARYNGARWVDAFLRPAINCGWDRSGVTIQSRDVVGNYTLTVTINQTPDPGETFTVDYATVDGTATAAEGDFTAASGTLTFNNGDLEQTITITVPAFTGKFAEEEFYVDLSNPSEGSISYLFGRRVTFRFRGDTTPITVSVGDATVTENPDDGDSNEATNVVTLSRESTDDLSFEWSTRLRSAGNTAAPAALFVAVTDEKVTIPEGSLTANLVTTVNDIPAIAPATTQYYDVVVSDLATGTNNPDTIADSGHDLEGEVAVTRNNTIAVIRTSGLRTRINITRQTSGKLLCYCGDYYGIRSIYSGSSSVRFV